MLQMNKTVEKLLIRFNNSVLPRFYLQTEESGELVCWFTGLQTKCHSPYNTKNFL